MALTPPGLRKRLRLLPQQGRVHGLIVHRRAGEGRPRPRPRPLVAGHLRDRPRPAHGADVALWGGERQGGRARRHHPPDRHGGHALHCHQLRPDGGRLPERGLGLRLRGAHDPPGARVRDGLEHALRLRDEPDHLRDLVQQGGRQLPAPPLPGVGDLLRAPLHVPQPAGRQDERPHERPHRGRPGVRDRPLPLLRLPLPVRGTARRGRPRPAVLRPRDLLLGQGVDRHQPGGAHLHRLRRHLHPLRRGEEPAAQHPARDRPRLPLHRDRGQPPGVSRPAHLARLVELPGRRHRLRPRGRPRRRANPVRDPQHGAPRRQRRIRNGGAPRGEPPPLRHGPRRRDPAALLRRREPEDARAEQQRHPRRRDHTRRGLYRQLRPGGRAPQLRGLHRLHGREPLGAPPLLVAGGEEDGSSTSCRRSSGS